MARSPYYPRRRSRLQSSKPKPPPKANGEGEQSGIGKCLICDAHLPFIVSDGLLYLQTPLGCLREARYEEGCPWVVYMEAGTPEEW